MATFSKIPLSGNTSGMGILINSGSSGVAGPTLHTGSSSPSVLDEVWLYAVNYDTTDRKLTIQYGGVTAGTNEIEYTVKAENGLYLIVSGLVLAGNATPKVISAYAATNTSIVVYGYVNRIIS
jgi:Zn-dependent alcohol dehydrogenase